MKKFTVKSRMFGSDFLFIEKFVGVMPSDFFKKFMGKYAGLSIEEEYFVDKQNRDWIVKSFCQSTEVWESARELKKAGLGLKVPFAYEEGGWHYCISYDKETYGKIIVNRWHNVEPEEQFTVIADSFEEFINGLEKRPDRLK